MFGSIRSIGSKFISFLSKSKFRQIHKDGTIEIALGLIIGVFAYDRYLQNISQDRSIALHEGKTRIFQQMLAEEKAKNIGKAASEEGSSNEIMKSVSSKKIKDQIDALDSSVRSEMNEKYKDKQALFQCKVRRVPQPGMFDGHCSLGGVQLNEIVDVLEENVGPGKMYNLCRTRVGSSSNNMQSTWQQQIGWFPKSYLEKLVSSVNNNETT